MLYLHFCKIKRKFELHQTDGWRYLNIIERKIRKNTVNMHIGVESTTWLFIFLRTCSGIGKSMNTGVLMVPSRGSSETQNEVF